MIIVTIMIMLTMIIIMINDDQNDNCDHNDHAYHDENHDQGRCGGVGGEHACGPTRLKDTAVNMRVRSSSFFLIFLFS